MTSLAHSLLETQQYFLISHFIYFISCYCLLIPMPLLCLWSLCTLHSWLISLQHVVQVTSKIIQIIDIALGCITGLESWPLLLKILRILYYDESIFPVVEPSWYKKIICKLLRREKQLNTPTQLQYPWTTTMIIMKVYSYIYCGSGTFMGFFLSTNNCRKVAMMSKGKFTSSKDQNLVRGRIQCSQLWNHIHTKQ